MMDDAGSTRRRMPRRSRVRSLMGALVPRSRLARRLLGILLGVVSLASLGALGIYVLIATGVLTANMATPYIEQALADYLGPGHKVSIAETRVETMDDGGTAIVVNQIRVDGPNGQTIASAPSAEVELQGSLLSLAPRAKRIDLVGPRLVIHIGATGSLAVSTGEGQQVLSPGRRPSAQTQASAPAAQSPAAAPAAQDAPAAAAPGSDPAAAALASELEGDPLVLRTLARWIEDLEKGGFDGNALADVGVKDATLIVENESSGRRVVFEHISVRLARPKGGGIVLTFTSHGSQGQVMVVASIGAVTGDERRVNVTVKDVSTRDLNQAFNADQRRWYMDTPLNAALDARLALDGTVRAARASVTLGAGQLGNGEEPEERFVIDQASLVATLDPRRRAIVLDPIMAVKNANKIALKGEIAVPTVAVKPWAFTIAAAQVVLAGPEMDDPPLAIPRVDITGRYLVPERQIVVEKGELGSPVGSMTFTSLIDFGVEVPRIKFDGVASRMPVSTLKRFWPVNIAPPARTFAIENMSGGTVDGATVAVNLPLALIGQKQVPLPEDGVSFAISGQGITLRPVKGLPPIVNAKLAAAVTGRSVRLTLPSGTLQTPQNRKIAVSDGVMLIPDYFPREPSSQIRVKFDGPADAGIEVLGMEPLKGPTGAAFDPSTTRGKLSALLQVNIVFRRVGKPEDLDYSLEADLTDFGVDKVFRGQRLEGATVKAFASPAGIVLRGDGKLGGAPVAFEYEKKKDVADADIRVSASLDDAARARLGVDIPGVSGVVGVRVVGTTNNKDTRASIEADLTNARLADLIPGLSKPAGKPLKAKFVINDKGNTVRLDDLLMEGSGTLLKGSLELSDSGDLLSANFPTFQLSDGDKANLKAEKAGGILKIRITGEVMDARGIMKSLMDTPGGPRRAQGKPLDVDVDAKVGALTGNNGEVLRQFELAVSRRGSVMSDLRLTAKAGKDGTLAGEIRRWQNKPNVLMVTMSDAGAVFRFLDIYAKIYRGEAWLMLDPPRGDDTPQQGVLHLRDFSIRGEPGLERLSAAARDPQGRPEANFDKAQVGFERSSGKVVMRDGAIWGPSVGATFDGTLDFAADRIAMRGTFVPAYGLNNMFSKLPVIGFFLGGGPNEGLVGVTFEIVGPLSGPTLRINPISAVAPGFLRKMFEFRSSSDAPPTR